MAMLKSVIDRVIKEANYIIEHKANMRDTGKTFNVSRQTVFIDMNSRLKRIDMDLYIEVRKVIDENNQNKHVRGGCAPKHKRTKRANQDAVEEAKQSDI